MNRDTLEEYLYARLRSLAARLQDLEDRRDATALDYTVDVPEEVAAATAGLVLQWRDLGLPVPHRGNGYDYLDVQDGRWHWSEGEFITDHRVALLAPVGSSYVEDNGEGDQVTESHRLAPLVRRPRDAEHRPGEYSNRVPRYPRLEQVERVIEVLDDYDLRLSEAESTVADWISRVVRETAEGWSSQRGQEIAGAVEARVALEALKNSTVTE